MGITANFFNQGDSTFQSDILNSKSFNVLADIGFLFNEVIYSAKQNISFCRNNDEMEDMFKKVFLKISLEMKRKGHVQHFLTEIAAYDMDLFIHSLNVTIYSLAIAKEIGLNDNALYSLAISGLLHDIGKLSVPTEILYKDGRLTPGEFETVKSHTTNGFRYLCNNSLLPSFVLSTVLQHHERVNGRGYPHGIYANDIHPFAKIIAIADVFDALTSERCYKRAMTTEAALSVLEREADGFDHHMLTSFTRLVKVLPIGSTVKLNNGLEGVVIKHTNNPFKPIVTVQGNTFNLSEEHALFIQHTDSLLGFNSKIKARQQNTPSNHFN